MIILRIVSFLYIISFLSGCGTSEDNISVATTVNSATYSLKIDAGEDKWVTINESVIIEGINILNDQNVSSYLWTYQGNTLATTRIFTYTPTVLGVDTLDFSVLYSNGLTVNDSLKVMVISAEVNLSIPIISETLKLEYITAINQARSTAQSCGIEGNFPATTALVWSDKLYSAAYEHSQDLIVSQTFAHAGSGTESDWTGYKFSKQSDFIDRSEAYGYQWNNLGENLAGGSTMDTAVKAVDAWLLSDGHCANLMNPNFTEVGMAMISEGNSLYTNYWSQNFGTPK